MEDRIKVIDKELERLNNILKDETKRYDAKTIQITLDKMRELNAEKSEIIKASRNIRLKKAERSPRGNSNLKKSPRQRKEFDIADCDGRTSFTVY